MPQSGRDPLSRWLDRFHGLREKGAIGFIRTSHHQPGFQLVITRFRQLGSLVAVGGGVDQRAEHLPQRDIGRVTDQAVVCRAVPGQHRVEQLMVMIQTKALIPGRALLSIMQQATGVVSQVMECRELVIRYGRMLHQGMSLLGNRDYLHAVYRKRQQYSRPPDTNDDHQRPGKRLLPSHTDTAATHAAAVLNNPLPGCRQGQRMTMCPRDILFSVGCALRRSRGFILRQAEHQATQRNALLRNREPRHQLLSPAGDSAVFEMLAQPQQEIVAVIFRDLTHPLRPQGRQHPLQLAGNIVRLSTQRESGTNRLFSAFCLRPLTVAQFPQPDRGGIAQQFADFFQPAQVVFAYLRRQGERRRYHPHNTVQRTATAQLAQRGVLLVIGFGE